MNGSKVVVDEDGMKLSKLIRRPCRTNDTALAHTDYSPQQI